MPEIQRDPSAADFGIVRILYGTLGLRAASSLDLFLPVDGNGVPNGPPNPVFAGSSISVFGGAPFGTLQPMPAVMNPANSTILMPDASQSFPLPPVAGAMNQGDVVELVLPAGTIAGTLMSGQPVPQAINNPGNILNVWPVNFGQIIQNDVSGAPVLLPGGTATLGMFLTAQGGNIGFVLPHSQVIF